ncbi:unnamed protein product [Somion occarium]|uniref:Aminoglycoside phosphotransferase domain-containing protein n=1 Tax=Somion occarium TaxID=3059160 RepID=A0ABP1DU57_9APHY
MILTQTAMRMMRYYPERSLFEWEPLLENLIPEDAGEIALDTPEFRREALIQASKISWNPLCYWLGTRPLPKAEKDEDIPWQTYVAPPPLPEIKLEDIVLVRDMNPGGNTPLFEVKIGGVSRLLKVFMSLTSPSWYNAYARELDPKLSLRLYHAEKEAYAHLRHFGACESGVVPNCYGTVQLSRQQAIDISRQFSMGWDLPVDDENLPYALLLEHFPDAIQVSIYNVTFPVAERALRALCTVHKSYVQHGDINGRNVLVLPDDRVVWIDFDHAKSASDPTLCRQDIWNEIREGWGYFYQLLLPDARIGFISPLY